MWKGGWNPAWGGEGAWDGAWNAGSAAGDWGAGANASGDWGKGATAAGDWGAGAIATGDWGAGADAAGDWGAGANAAGDWGKGATAAGDWGAGATASGDWGAGANAAGDWGAGANAAGDWDAGANDAGDWGAGANAAGDWGAGANAAGDWGAGATAAGDWGAGATGASEATDLGVAPPQPNAGPKVVPAPARGPEQSSTMEAPPPLEEPLFGDEFWFLVTQRPFPARRTDHERSHEEDDEDRSLRETLNFALGGPGPGSAEVGGRLHRRQELFVQGLRLLYAILGFRGEGNCSHLVRGRAISRVPLHPGWRGLSPMALIAQWLNSQALLDVYASKPIRRAFDLVERSIQAQFISALLRVASLEALQQCADPVRVQWAKVFALFPETGPMRMLLRHIRRRCWEDARDKSRSRSRSRDRKGRAERQPAQSQAQEDYFPGVENIRFFVKGCGSLDEGSLAHYFEYFGQVLECAALRDKRTKKSRGMAFVTLSPQGSFEGKKITLENVREWMLNEVHDCFGNKLEVSEANKKEEVDEERKREERMEERRRQREDRESRRGEAGEAVMVPTPWAKRWRKEMQELFPPEASGATPLSHPSVREMCQRIWQEASDHASRHGGEDVREALATLKAESGAWAYLPAADLLLTVGEGIVGITAEGVFTSEAKREPIQPMAAVSPQGAPIASSQGGADASASAQSGKGLPGNFANVSMGAGRCWEKGGSDDAKIFVGGLTYATTLDKLTGYFSKYGEIVDAVVMMDKVSGKPRGFGFVVFDRPQALDGVMNDYNMHRIDNKWVEVKRATPYPTNGAPPPSGGVPVANAGAAQPGIVPARMGCGGGGAGAAAAPGGFGPCGGGAQSVPLQARPQELAGALSERIASFESAEESQAPSRAFSEGPPAATYDPFS